MFAYGQIGDGNAHLRIVTKDPSQDLHDRMHQYIDNFVIEYCVKNKGSIQAKFGVGLQLAAILPTIKDKTSMKVMKILKEQLDP